MAAGDSFTPDAGQRIDAQGRVTYDFSGHISAEGLDMLAVTTGGGPIAPTPPDDRRVRWLRESDGSLVAEVFGYDPTTGKRGLWVGAGEEPDIEDNPATRRLIVDETGASSFLQLNNGGLARRTCTYWGAIPVSTIPAGGFFGPVPLVIVAGFGTPCVTTGIGDSGVPGQPCNQISLMHAVVSTTQINFYGHNRSAAPAAPIINYHIFGEL